ncbi:putative aromatic compound monooxygenase YhjG [Sphaerisporangium krabiense]|uniref:2-polyprenyl-6-methoxyphenol hydroxylase-like FAD-dependent oxidoreductase n=1 Tax=Sphaerisporangium krabiense TaxID=763782 RepID=A0A7W8Z271_9ACTN|nr:FAD-dependent oxidoreductase [Sphaerisporangium krabiense]MBB5626069.1 2-polyprenyl-6-methoxyphenol hydroxylase-like FAD-dependent oxidoreductase [Sphaerisporangium krabiense]GII64873.1 putative aromatic compound monooxygenase YhjG [Sphaerisporangium krabiense]
MRTTDADVIVIGGGPSGATVAAEAARAGARVIVLEKREGDSPSRAGVIQPRVLELLDARGLMGRFREAAKEWRPDFEVPRYIYAGLVGLRYDLLDSAHPYALILPQTTTEHLLRDWAVESGADVRRGVTYIEHTEHTEDGGGVTVTALDADGATVRLGARFLVGADGARSAVRTRAGVPFEGRDAEMTAVSVDADLTFPWAASMQMRRNENGWVLAYPFGRRTTRFIIVAEARRTVPRGEPVTIEEVRESLRAIFGEDFGITTAKWLSRYGDTHKTTPYLHRGRVSLVGESTRVHYPASGIGMNYCIQDAFNLGWKLGLVATGDAPEALLRTYDEERYPVLQDLMDDVAAQCKLHFDFTPAGLKLKEFFEDELIPVPEVNAILRDRLSGFKTTYHREGDPHPADGTRVGELSLGDRRYTEVAARSLFVLVERADGAPATRQPPDRVTRVVAEDPGFGRELAGASAALIRPDAYVARAWAAAPSDQELRAAYDQATGRAVRAELTLAGH